MPEGDTIFRTATTLRKALCGQPISRLEVRPDPAESNSALIMNHDSRMINAIEPRGKHLLIVMRKTDEPGDPIRVPERLDIELLRNDLVLHTHLRMTGSWHIYR